MFLEWDLIECIEVAIICFDINNYFSLPIILLQNYRNYQLLIALFPALFRNASCNDRKNILNCYRNAGGKTSLTISHTMPLAAQS